MSREPEDAPQHAWISEDDAHRLLARAVELDARDATSVSVERLREVAREAGIAPHAFGEALSELRAGTLGPTTIGQLAATRLATYRRHAFALAFVGASLITPGDLLAQTITMAFALYGAYEGAVILARWLGRHPNRPTPLPPPRPIVQGTKSPSPAGDDARPRLRLVFRTRRLAAR